LSCFVTQLNEDPDSDSEHVTTVRSAY